MHHFRFRALTSAVLPASFALALTAPGADAQVVFSIDYFGTTISAPDSFGGTAVTEGDVLTPAIGDPAMGPLPTPGIDISAGAGGLGLFGYTGCLGHAPGVACRVEVDALSYGRDERLNANATGVRPGGLWFSVDAYALGFGAPFAPGVTSEGGAIGDLSSDALVNALPMPAGPLPPFAAVPSNTGVFDGNGLASLSGYAYPGIGLREPTFPVLPPLGDNLDALNVDGPNPVGGSGFPAGGVYFSLEGATFDPVRGVVGSGSAGFHGFTGADVLLTLVPGGAPAVYAGGPLLGLNIAGGIDDLDALVLTENGAAGFQRSMQPYDWTTGATDMLLFSVRRGSPVVGMPDSIFGIPIAPGDVLTTPLPTFLGGVSPFPGIMIAAENLALRTMRSHGVPGDEVDALDTLGSPFSDCNENGVEDAVDIHSGESSDANENGVPDECELIGGPSCRCQAGAPCGNAYAQGGCRNSTGLGSILSAVGTGSVTADDLVLTATQVPVNQPGILFRGSAAIGPFPFGDGLRCVGGSVVRFAVQNSGPGGVLSEGPGIAAAEGIGAFETWHFQAWFRDPVGPCGSGFNTSNAFEVLFTL